MQKKFSFFQFATVLLACTSLVSAGIFLYVRHLTIAQQKEVVSALQEFAAQDAKHIEMQVAEDLDLLTSLAASLSILPDPTDEQLIQFLQVERAQNHFKNMEVVRPDGLARLDNGKLLDLSKENHFQKALAGTPNISPRLEDFVDGAHILVEAAPIIHQNKPIGVLMATRNTADFAQLLDMQSFGGNGYSLLVEADGDKVVESFHKNAISGLYNIFDMPDDPDHSLRHQVLQDFSARKSGVIKYHSKARGTLYISYQPLNINDWYLMTVVPEQFITKITQNFITMLPVLGVLISVAAFLLGGYMWGIWPLLKHSLSHTESTY